jgi:hypothetical protein
MDVKVDYFLVAPQYEMQSIVGSTILGLTLESILYASCPP